MSTPEDLTGSLKYISDFDETNPPNTGQAPSYGDDHIRGIKNAIKNTFPNIDAPVTATEDELNALDGYTGNAADLNILAGADTAGVTSTELQYLNGVTSAIQTQLDAKEAADATILKDADIGVTLQAYNADIPTQVMSQAEAEAGTSTDNRTVTAERIKQAIAALASGGYEPIGDPYEPTSDVNPATITGLSGYRDIKIVFAFYNSGGVNAAIDVRTSGGTWRELNSINSTATVYGEIEMLNFGMTTSAIKSFFIRYSDDATVLDRSNFIDGGNGTGRHGYFTYAESLDEIRWDCSNGSIEGSTADQRAFFQPYGRGVAS
jgi:hypothetical protein